MTRHHTGSLYAQKQFEVLSDANVLPYYLKSVFILSTCTFAFWTPSKPVDSAFLFINRRGFVHTQRCSAGVLCGSSGCSNSYANAMIQFSLVLTLKLS